MSSENEPPVQDTEVSVAQGNNKLNTVAERRAKRLLDRVQRGETLSAAADAERMTVAEIKNEESLIGMSVRQLIGSYFLPPEARKQMVRAGLNKVFAENVISADPAAQKVALDAAKQIAADPEVGLTATDAGGVIINIGELAGIFQQIRATRPPEVNDGRESGTDREVEAEFTDITP